MDPDVINLAKAIRTKESNNRFDAVGDNGTSRGAYQWQAGTWSAMAKDILGDPNAKMTPANQNAVAYGTLKKWKDSGLNPAQIAAKWNSGSEKGWENKIGYNSKIGVNYNVPQYVKGVTDLYQQFKTQNPQQQQQQPVQPQLSPRESRIEKGLPVSVNPNKSNPSMGGELLRGILKTPAKLATNLYGAVGGASKLLAGDVQGASDFMNRVTQEGVNTNYLGNIKPVGQTGNFGQDVKESLGAGLEMGSYVIGAGPAGAAVRPVATQAAKRLGLEVGEQAAKQVMPRFGQALKRTAVGEGIAGGVGTLGTELQKEGQGVGAIAANTVLGTIIGGAAGGLLGGGSAIVGRKLQTAREAAKDLTTRIFNDPTFTDEVVNAGKEMFRASIGDESQVSRAIMKSFKGDEEAFDRTLNLLLAEELTEKNLSKNAKFLVNPISESLKKKEKLTGEILSKAYGKSLNKGMSVQELEQAVLEAVSPRLVGSVYREEIEKSIKDLITNTLKGTGRKNKIDGKQLFYLQKNLGKLGYVDGKLKDGDFAFAAREARRAMKEFAERNIANPEEYAKLIEENNYYSAIQDAQKFINLMKNAPEVYSQIAGHMVGVLAGSATAGNPLAYFAGRVMTNKLGRFVAGGKVRRAIAGSPISNPAIKNALTTSVRQKRKLQDVLEEQAKLYQN